MTIERQEDGRPGDAYGPRFRASHRAALRLGLTASIAIAGENL